MLWAGTLVVLAGAQRDYDLRIVAPSGAWTSTYSATINSGRLEIFYNSTWGEHCCSIACSVTCRSAHEARLHHIKWPSVQ